MDLLYFRFSRMLSLERIEEKIFLACLGIFGLCCSANLPSKTLEVLADDFYANFGPVCADASAWGRTPFAKTVYISFFLENFPEVKRSIFIFLICENRPSDLKSFEIMLPLAVVVWFRKLDLNVDSGFFCADSVRIG